MSVVAAQCDTSQPKGCFVSLFVSEAASDCMPAQAKELVSQAAVFMPELLEGFFNNDPEAVAAGLDKDANKNALFLATTLHGTAAMARAEKTLLELEPVIDNSLKGIGL